ncbi:MAG: hypothetical protein JWP25_7272 [Bradyrhizobium sp.]|nr:hypothetical protein [Bradyrhizobium sp.]
MTGKISDDADRVVDGTEKVAAEKTSVNYGILISSIATYLASLAQTLTSKTIDAGANTVSNLTTSMFAANVIDTDGTLTANSDTRVASQKALKTYANQIIAAADAMVFKGVVDCSASPNYPAADRGNTYKVSVAGLIGGASGIKVEVGDTLMCITDGTAAGTQAAVGAQWNIVQANLVGAVTGPTSSVSSNVATFNGTGGTVIQDSGKPISAMPSSAGHMPATATNDVAASGEVGEYISATSTGAASTVTISIGTPATITDVGHGKSANSPVTFTTTGALPTGITAGTTYYVEGASITSNTYQIATSIANAVAGVAVATSGAQSGAHTCTGNANLTTNVAKDIIGVPLTAGEWIVSGCCQFSSAGSTSTTFLGEWMSTTSASFSSALADGYASFNGAAQVGYNSALPTGQKRVLLAAPGIVYFSVLATFTVSTMTAAAFISARRPR